MAWWVCVKKDGSRAWLGRAERARDVKALIPDYVRRVAGNYSCERVRARDARAVLPGVSVDGRPVEITPCEAARILEQAGVRPWWGC